MLIRNAKVILSILAIFLIHVFSFAANAEQQVAARGAESRKDDKNLITWSDKEIYIQADSVFSPEEGVTVATGYVEIYYKDQHIQADKVTYNRSKGLITAEGNVTVQSEDTTVSCERMEGLTDGTGIFYNALVYAGEQIIRAEIIKRNPDKAYTLESAEITPCAQVTPCWSLKVGSGRLVPGEYVSMSNIFMRIKDIPVFYIPFFYLPLDSETGRTAGFLFPSFGSSGLYGTTFSESFFLPFSRSVDATLTANYYSEKGLGFGIEGRYLFDAYSGGSIAGTYLKESNTDTVRYTLNAYHRQNIAGWKLVLNGKITSDITYNQEYSDDINNITGRSNNYINASLSKRIGPLALEFVTNYDESIVSGQDMTVKAKLPTAGISLNQLKLFGSPVYISLDADYANLQKTTSIVDYRYQRLDLKSEIGASLTGLSWLKLNPRAIYRYTNYSDSLNLSNGTMTGEPLVRDYLQFDMKIIGPSFYKIYFMPESEYADKLKHVIEPTISYSYISEPTNTDRIIYYDGVDYILPINELRITLANRLIANKRINPGVFKPREILTWQLSQYISLNPQLKSSYGSQYNRFATGEVVALSPLVSDLTFRPGDSLNLTNRVEYDYNSSMIASVSVDLRWNTPDVVSNIQWRKTSAFEEGRIASNQLMADGKFRLFDRLFDLFYKFSYDVEQDKLWLGSVSMRYNHQCFSLIFSYDYYNIGLRNEGKFSFNVELTGISGMLPDIMK
jgi:lipopolysaccharide assembly outer membrane protein LptD (OstA)